MGDFYRKVTLLFGNSAAHSRSSIRQRRAGPGPDTATMRRVSLSRRSRLAVVTVSVLLLAVTGCRAGEGAPAASMPVVSVGVLGAAQSFLGLLDDDQRTAVSGWRSATNLAHWSFLPDAQFPRAGLRLDALSEPQQEAALGILRAGLSNDGYNQVIATGSGPFWIRILGSPSATELWTVQYGGPGLALNLTVRGLAMTLAPTLWGGPLTGETAKALALMATLDRAQRQQAMLTPPVTGLLLGPGQDGKTLPPEGVRVSGFTDEQKVLLMALLTEWMTTLDSAVATGKLATAQAGLPDTTFAWSGGTTTGGPFYYRVQGPMFTIESTGLHAVYREPGNDYGAGL
jgi:hypothetical protein